MVYLGSHHIKESSYNSSPKFNQTENKNCNLKILDKTQLIELFLTRVLTNKVKPTKVLATSCPIDPPHPREVGAPLQTILTWERFTIISFSPLR